jgi:CubicO group peptidase (beta-lactamase class C family)
LEPEEVIRRIRHVKLTTSFRSTWEYANIPFLTAGTAVSLRAKKPLADCFRERIFQPLGMNTATGAAADFLKAPNRAVGYRPDDHGKLERTEPLIYDSRGAGDISACVRDLGPWLRFQLGDGTFNGKRLVPAKHFRETHAPQMVVKMTEAQKANYPDSVQLSYALGWAAFDYKGNEILSHGGSLTGYRSQTVLVPKAKLGVVALTNRNPSLLTEAVTRAIVDRYLNMPDKDWNGHFLKVEKKVRADKDKKEADTKAKRIAGTKPSREVQTFVGAYDHPAYGKATITTGKDGLSIQWSSFTIPLEHWHHDTFRNIAPQQYVLEGEFLTFNFEHDGAVRGMRWLGQDFVREKATKKAAK